MNDGKTNCFLLALTGLVVLNLILTFRILTKVSHKPTPEMAESQDHKLPKHIRKVAKDKLFQKFKTAYNSTDPEQFWNLFNDFAKSKMKKEEMASDYEKMVRYFGEIVNGQFINSVLKDRQEEFNVYSLHYNIRLTDQSKFGDIANLTILLMDTGKDFGIISAYINTEAKIKEKEQKLE